MGTPLIDMVMKIAECPSVVRFTRLNVKKNVRNIFFSKYNDKIHKLLRLEIQIES